ncbi:hypothetical protein QFZ80_001471 [Paenibacillus sp. V4I7]|nr:hypothetical protein [Paenibacillus sp. V4I7]
MATFSDIPELIRKRSPKTRVAPFLLFQNSLEFIGFQIKKGCLLQNSLEKNLAFLQHMHKILANMTILSPV